MNFIECSIIFVLGFALGVVLNSCAENQPDKEVTRLKTLSQECVNICPRGVSKFEIQYSNSTCECKP